MEIRDFIERIKSIGIRQGDLFVVALLLVLSLVLLCFGMTGSDGGSVRICVDGDEIALLSLERDTVYEIPGGMGNVVEISGGRARMTHAECPDGSCMGQGFVERTGECIVCLPARVTVTVVAQSGTQTLDAVAY